MADVTINIKAQGSGATKKAFQEIGKSAKRASKDVNGLSSGFKSVFAGVISANAASAAFRGLSNAARGLFNTLVTEGIAAANQQEDAITALNSALAATGEFSQETSQDIQAFASSLQAVSTVGDEVILQNIALAQSFTQNADQAKELTAAALDFAEAADLNFTEAVRRLGRATKGTTDDIAKFAPEIRALTKDQLAAGEATRIIAERFRGAAAAQAQTFGGAIIQLTNTFGDLQEQFGFAITQNDAFISVVGAVNSILKELESTFKDNGDAIQESLAQGLITGIRLFQGLVAAAEPVEVVIRGVAATISGLVGTLISAAVAAEQVANGNFAQAFETIKTGAIDAGKGVADALSADTISGEIGGALARVGDAAEEGFAKLKEGADTSGIAVRSLTGEIDKLTSAQIEAALKGEQLQERLAGENQADKFAMQNEQLTEALSQQLITREEFLIAQNELEARFEENREGRLQKEIDQINQRNALLAQVQGEEAKREIAQNTAQVNAILAKEKQLSTVLLKEIQRRENARRAILEQRLQTTASIFGNLASLQQSGSKDLFEIGKAAAVAEATINAALAVTKALATGGPFLGPVLAAAIAVKTAVQIANIQSTNLQGGLSEVPAGFPGDTFPANLSTGERVVSAEQNTDLKEFIAANRNNQAILSVIAETLSNMNPNVSVEVGGSVIIDTINDEIKGGRRLLSA